MKIRAISYLYTLSLHDALPISTQSRPAALACTCMPALWRLTTRTAASTCRFSRPRLSESQFQDQDQLTPSLFLYSMPILLAATLMTQYLENRVDSKLPSDARRLISAARASNLLSSAAWVMLTWKLNRLIAH